MRKEITEDQITQLLAAIQRAEEVDRLKAEIERLRTGLHRISLASQNSMSSREECGRIARETLEIKP